MKQHGYSIIELMIAITLGLILTLGLIELFVNNKTSYRIQEGLARVQENGRFAKYYLNKEIRMAGYHGCTNLALLQPNILVRNPGPNILFDTNNVIYGHEGSGGAWSPALPAYLSGLAVPGTDIITIRKASSLGVNLIQNMPQPTSAILVDDRLGIQAGDILFITDCDIADIFMAGANTTATSIAHGASDNISSGMSKAYQTDAQLMRFESNTFYIGDTGRTNSTGQPILALYQFNITGNTLELIEGVQDMQITYGVDTTDDDTADTYLTADAVSAANQWTQVKSVNISLLLNTIEEVNPTAQQYVFQNQTTIPADRMLHRQWDTFITLRNR